jgi:Putative Na+/H+ antiporter
MQELIPDFPRALSSYPSTAGQPLWDILTTRIQADPLNAVATVIFMLAVIHTFFAARFKAAAHHAQHRHDAECSAAGVPSRPSVKAELLHFLGEVEVVFALWGLPLLVAIAASRDWHTAVHYLNNTVNYQEAMFVVVIMALASTRPVVQLAETILRSIARMGGCTPVAWWMTILIVAPLLGSLITEAAAMTIGALLLARQFFDLKPSATLRYATLGLLFVNVSIGGTLTHFAAPPVLMVANAWGWDTPFMLGHFGIRATGAIVLSTVAYALFFRKEFKALGPGVPEVEVPATEAVAGRSLLPIPGWVTMVHLGFMAWSVFNLHYPALLIGGFLFFLGFTVATAAYQSTVDIKTPLLVGFFLAGLVVHGGLQAWWIGPVLGRLTEEPLFWGATLLTAFNDNALITYLATLVPLSDSLKIAVVEGAVTGGGLTVIANAPNPAGQALLGRFFGGAIHPGRLFVAAAIPTLVAVAMFRWI